MNVELTVVSSRGQVVIPKNIRERLGLKEGVPLAVTEDQNIIMLQKMEFPSFDKMISESRKLAKNKGIKTSDVDEIIAKARRQK
jgi:AbrB family looped-hinge helix DNA binding protein